MSLLFCSRVVQYHEIETLYKRNSTYYLPPGFLAGGLYEYAYTACVLVILVLHESRTNIRKVATTRTSTRTSTVFSFFIIT